MARSSIYVGEIAHQSPIPNACRIGNIIVSGLIRGFDPATGKLAATLEQQCAFMFQHLRQTVEAGGATVEDIIKVTFWMEKLQRKVGQRRMGQDVSRSGLAPGAADHGSADGGGRADPMRLHGRDRGRLSGAGTMKFGVTLSNRGVLVGLCTPRDLLVLADAVEASPLMDSVWCGDALFVNRRLDALTLLAAVAGRTERVLLGPACMGSFALRNPLVFAYEWASLDVLSNGRTRLVACAGGGAGPLWEAETAALDIAPGERRKRMIENMRDAAPSLDQGQRAVRGRVHEVRQRHAGAEAGAVAVPDLARDQCRAAVQGAGGFRRLGVRAHARRQDRRRLDDAFGQSGGLSALLGVHPAGRRATTAATCRASTTCSTTTSTCNDDKADALADSKTFLDLYYSADYSKERLESWLTYGSPRDCIAHLKQFKDSRLPARHVPHLHHGRPDGAAAPRDRGSAAVRVTGGATLRRRGESMTMAEKRLEVIRAALLALVFAFGHTACSSDAPVPLADYPKQLVGEWQGTIGDTERNHGVQRRRHVRG